MATRIITSVVDDLDGEVLEDGLGETVRFALDGVQYEIDLSPVNAGALREVLAPYLSVARRSGSSQPRGSRPRTRTRSRSSELAEIRAWAEANGYEIAQRGRIPDTITAAYAAR